MGKRQNRGREKIITEKQIQIAETLFKNATRVSFGTVSVELKIHAGKCVNVIHTTFESTRQIEDGNVALE